MPVSEMVPNIPEPFPVFAPEVHRFPLLGSVARPPITGSGLLPLPLGEGLLAHPPAHSQLNPRHGFLRREATFQEAGPLVGWVLQVRLRARLCWVEPGGVTPASQGGARPLEGPRPHGSSDLSEMSEQLSPFPRPCPQLPLLSASPRSLRPAATCQA